MARTETAAIEIENQNNNEHADQKVLRFSSPDGRPPIMVFIDDESNFDSDEQIIRDAWEMICAWTNEGYRCTRIYGRPSDEQIRESQLSTEPYTFVSDNPTVYDRHKYYVQNVKCPTCEGCSCGQDVDDDDEHAH